MTELQLTRLRVKLKSWPDYPAHDIVTEIRHGDSVLYIVCYKKDWSDEEEMVQLILDEENFLDGYIIIEPE
jgi:hypothetical protein